eukprot:TRINITY_DN240_c0_g1_i1.p1 TRINITY_DN240_c0_g1~~TRINITY_DN240_c0_g1_i1.p1  ORF type:complete len:244 (-),score=97.51 TRINITY_DN240_c0_g1_i1:284-1015(-)
MFACGACSLSDRTSDTVKIDFTAVKSADEQPSVEKPEGLEDSRNLSRIQEDPDEEEAENEADAFRAEQEEARRLEEEQARREQQEEAERLEREAAAQRQREAEETRAKQVAEEAAAAEAAAKEAEEERAQAAEAERIRLEKEAEEAEKQRRLHEAEEKKRMEEFLKKHAFKGPDMKRSKLLGFKFPLHSAVKHNDVEMVRILLANGANTSSKDSSGNTPYQLAQKVDKHGSHAMVMETLAVVN